MLPPLRFSSVSVMGVTVTDPGPTGHRTFFVSFLPTRGDWPHGMSEDETRAISAHADGLSALADAGTCVVAGPCADGRLGVAVYDGVTLEDAVAQIRTDAMVVAGYFDAEVRAMRLSFEREKPATS
jgi:uncharacterized protein YciI